MTNLNELKEAILFTVGINLSWFPWWLKGKESACNARDQGSIPGSGRSPGKGNGNPLQYPCLENPMDGEAWWAAVHGFAKSWTQLNNFTSSLQPFWSLLSSEGKQTINKQIND